MGKKAARRDKTDGDLDVVVETPRGNRNKFKYDETTGRFHLGSVLPAGLSFPYDFGFVPDTKAEDGDPLDVLLLMDEAAFPGCIVKARIIGVIEAEQHEDGKAIRNDRIIAVAKDAHDYADIRSVDDINRNLLKELEHFFISYNQTRGKSFRLLGTKGEKRARSLLEAAKQTGKRWKRK